MALSNTFQELTPNIAMITLGFVNTYIIRDKHKLALVDTGLPGDLPAIDELLKKNWDHSLSDLTTVIITHAHQDHYGNAAELRKKYGTEILCHTLDAPVIEGITPPPAMNPTERDTIARQEITATGAFDREIPPLQSVSPVQKMEDNQSFDIADAVAIHSPGHTVGHMSVWFPEQEVLITGDSITSRTGKIEPGPFNFDNEQAKQTAYTLSKEFPSVIAGFGHGKPLLEDAAKIMESQLREWLDRPL